MAKGKKMLWNLTVLLRRLWDLFPVQQQEQSMVGMGGVSPDVVSPGQAVFFSNVLDGRKRASDDFLRCPHHPLRGLLVRGTAGS